MARLLALFLPALLILSACADTVTGPRIGADGKPLPQIYWIRPGETSAVQYRMLDAINALRQASGAQPLTFDSRLNAAAATHSRDMSLQNRPWHFGSDGSSPLDRVRRVGYQGELLGENISETFETEIVTLAAWMEEEHTRQVILDPKADEMGFAWLQEDNGKIWWTLVTGNSTGHNAGGDGVSS